MGRSIAYGGTIHNSGTHKAVKTQSARDLLTHEGGKIPERNQNRPCQKMDGIGNQQLLERRGGIMMNTELQAITLETSGELLHVVSALRTAQTIQRLRELASRLETASEHFAATLDAIEEETITTEIVD